MRGSWHKCSFVRGVAVIAVIFLTLPPFVLWLAIQDRLDRRPRNRRE